jgi:hypothetical protein
MGIKSTPKRDRKKEGSKRDLHGLMCELLLFIRMHRECVQLDCVSSHWPEKRLYVVPHEVLREFSAMTHVPLQRLESIMHLEGWMVKCSVKNAKGEFIAIRERGLKKISQIKTPVPMN